MPMGKFANFAECISAQKSKGHSTESAYKICGYLKHKIEDNGENGPPEISYQSENEVGVAFSKKRGEHDIYGKDND